MIPAHYLTILSALVRRARQQVAALIAPRASRRRARCPRCDRPLENEACLWCEDDDG